MFFNSIEYLAFLPLVFLFYWKITNKSLRLQNLKVIGASYLFYGWWDWRFLSLIIFSILVTSLVSIYGSSNDYDFSEKYSITEKLSNYYETSHYRPPIAEKIMEQAYRQELQATSWNLYSQRKGKIVLPDIL